MPKYDEAFNTIYQECLSDGLGGDSKFVEAFMSFLRRKTKLLSTDQSTKEVTIIARKVMFGVWTSCLSNVSLCIDSTRSTSKKSAHKKPKLHGKARNPPSKKQ